MRHRSILTVLLCLPLFGASIHADYHPQRQTVKVLDTSSLAPNTVTVPIQIVNGFVCVSAAVNGHRGLFLLDDGSPAILLNREYLQPAAQGNGLDTVAGMYEEDSALKHGVADKSPDWTANAVTVQIGSLVIPVTAQDAGSTMSMFGVAIAVPLPKVTEKTWGFKPLGILAFQLLSHYETIVDYTHRRLTLMPIDSVGRHLVVDTAYKPAATIPLIPKNHSGLHFYVEVNLGGIMDTMNIDSGESYNKLNTTTTPKLTTHVTPAGKTVFDDMQQQPVMTVDHLTLAGHFYSAVPFSVSPTREDALGNEFLSRLGIVGFNFRSRHLEIYL